MIKVRLLLEIADDDWLTRTMELPCAPWVGLDVEFAKPGDITCFDQFRLTAISWNEPDQEFEAYCDFIVEPSTETKFIHGTVANERLEILLAKDWKPNKP